MKLSNQFQIVCLTFLLSILSQSVFGQTQVNEIVDNLLRKYNQEVMPYKLYVNTDKNIYKEDERIWLSAIVLDRNSHKKESLEHEVAINIWNQNEVKVLEKHFFVKNGMGSTFINIPQLNTYGNFYLTASLVNYPKIIYQREIKINKNAIPSFLVNLSIEDKYYSAGDDLDIYVDATDYFNAPLKNAKFHTTLSSGSDPLYSLEGKLDKNGRGLIKYELPEVLPDKPLTFNIFISNNRYFEDVTTNIPIKTDQIFVEFYPEGGQLVHGLSNFMKIKVSDANGRAFPFKGVIVNEENNELGAIDSDQNGLASLPFLPDYNKKLKIVITEPYLVEKEFDFPEIKPVGALLSILKIGGDSVRLRIKSTLSADQEIFLMNINNGQSYFLEKVKISKNQDFKIGNDRLRSGINQLVLFDQNAYPLSEGLVYLNSPYSKTLSADINKESYKNRERVNLELTVNKNSFITLSVSDDYRCSADVPMQNIYTHLYLDSELSANELANNNIENSDDQQKLINSLLTVSKSVNNWDEIYAFGNVNIEFNYDSPKQYKKRPLLHISSVTNDKKYLVYSNYNYDIYYLASNPLLFEKLKQEEKKESNKPAYKTMLENGTPVPDVIFMMKPYTIMDNKIVFQGSQNSLIAQGGALIVVDGIRRGEDISVLRQFSPFDVDEINISTQPIDILNYTGLNSVGIIEINLKNGEKIENDDKKDLSPDFEFVNHENDEKEWKGVDDLRTTIHWTPFVPVEKGRENIHFYQSDVRSNFVGIIEGIDEDGLPIVEKVKYESFNYGVENQ